MQTFQFRGTGSEYFKIWVTNLFFTVITLGLYYPWAKVKSQKYFYGNTALSDRRFDYHATGKQLFRSYLVAVTLLISYNLLGHFIPMASALMGFMIAALFPWILWKSMQFRMQMTSFSHVRFGFRANLRSAYVNFLALPILFALSFFSLPLLIGVVMGLNESTTINFALLITIFLSLALISVLLISYTYSVLIKRQMMYQINGLKFGQDVFSVILKTRVYFAILLKTIALSFLCFVAWIIFKWLLFVMIYGFEQVATILQQSVSDPITLATKFENIPLGLIIGSYIGGITLSFVIFAFIQTRQRNYLFSQIRLGQTISLASTLKTRSLAWVMFSNFMIVIVTMGFGLPWAKVRTARLFAQNTLIKGELVFDDYISHQRDYQTSLGDQIGDVLDLDAGLII
jgi:uncharacterized membrane protein YjgN (DUF898 family)